MCGSAEEVRYDGISLEKKNISWNEMKANLLSFHLITTGLAVFFVHRNFLVCIRAK